MSYAISATDVVKTFSTKRALDGLTLEVEAGEVLGMIGPNGAGKTTFMRCLLDFLRPNSGQIKVFGNDLRHSSATIRNTIGYLPGETDITDAVTLLGWEKSRLGAEF